MLAKISKIKGISSVWIIPIVSLLIGLWFIYSYYSKLGKEITIYTMNADDIEAGKTKVKSRNVNIGDVINVELSKDLSRVILTVRMQSNYNNLLKKDTVFWVVKPRIDSQGVSGLGTLLSGPYIELVPGKSSKFSKTFEMSDSPVRITSDYKGTSYILTSEGNKSVGEGDVVSYRGINVGFVDKISFDVATRKMKYTIFIYEPYNKLVTVNTRFWNSSGFNVSLNSSGMKIETSSIESILQGGISFSEPQNMPLGKIAEQNTEFVLYNDEEDSLTPSYKEYIDYIVLLNDSFRGLLPGASVEYKGYRVGTVMDVPYQQLDSFNIETNTGALPILIRIEKERLTKDTKTTLDDLREYVNNSIKIGMRATIKTGSMLTGAKFIDLVMEKNAQPVELTQFDGITIFPSASGDDINDITAKISLFMDKLNNLPLDKLSDNMNALLANSSATAKELNNLAKSIDKLVNSHELKNMPKEINETLKKVQKILDAYNNNSKFYDDLGSSIKELSLILKDLSVTSKKLSEKPNSLIFDNETNEPQPRRPR